MAQDIVLLIDQLFGIDAEARAQEMDWAGRDGLRQQHARPLLNTIKQQIEAARVQALPAGKLGSAITYTLALWDGCVARNEFVEASRPVRRAV